MAGPTDTTKVLFPRFEFEFPHDGPIESRQVSERFMPNLVWPSVSESDHLTPFEKSAAACFAKERVADGWIGHEHWAQETWAMPRAVLAPELQEADGEGNVLFQARLIEHRIRWHQNSPTEVRKEVLVGPVENTSGEGFVDELALLLSARRQTHGGSLMLAARYIDMWVDAKQHPNQLRVGYLLEAMYQAFEA